MPYLIMLVILGLGVYFSLKGQQKDPLAQMQIWPYIKNPAPLDPLEINFCQALEQYLNKDLYVCPKMPLERIVYIPQNARLKRSMKDKIRDRWVDFAICDRKMELVCVIDLAGSNDSDAAFRPELQKIMKNAGISCFSFTPAYEYTGEMFETINRLYQSGSYR